MPYFTRADLTLHYTETGDPAGWPVLLLAPGGMRSAGERWQAAPWNPHVRLPEFRVIGMDQRNAGASRGPIEPDHGWRTYLQDQLALVDHLGVDRFHVVGMCIGGSYGLALMREVPDRVISAVLLQPIGEEDGNRSMFYELFDAWAQAIGPDHPEVDGSGWAAFRERMFGGDFVFNLTQEQVAECSTPTFVLAGSDRYHPPAISREIARRIRGATCQERWKEDLVQADAQIRAFLFTHTPSRTA